MDLKLICTLGQNKDKKKGLKIQPYLNLFSKTIQSYSAVARVENALCRLQEESRDKETIRNDGNTNTLELEFEY